MPAVTIALYRLIAATRLIAWRTTSPRSTGSVLAAARNLAAAAFSSCDALTVTGPDALMLSTTRRVRLVAAACFWYSVSSWPDLVSR